MFINTSETPLNINQIYVPPMFAKFFSRRLCGFFYKHGKII